MDLIIAIILCVSIFFLFVLFCYRTYDYVVTNRSINKIIDLYLQLYSIRLANLAPNKVVGFEDKQEDIDNILSKSYKTGLSKVKDPDGRRWITKEDEELEYHRPVFIKGINLTSGMFTQMDMIVLTTWRLVSPVNNKDLYKGDLRRLMDLFTEIAIRDFFEHPRAAIHTGKTGKAGEFSHLPYDPVVGDKHGNTGDEYRSCYFPYPLTYEYWMEDIVKRKRASSLLEEHLKTFNATSSYYGRIKKKAEENLKTGEILKKLDELTCGFYKEGKGSGDESEECKVIPIPGMGQGEGFIHSLGFAMTSLLVVKWEVY